MHYVRAHDVSAGELLPLLFPLCNSEAQLGPDRPALTHLMLPLQGQIVRKDGRASVSTYVMWMHMQNLMIQQPVSSMAEVVLTGARGS